MENELLTDQVILDGLLSGKCICGSKKKSRRSHCRTCYHLLPPEQRAALYRKFNAGYREAYRTSIATLGITPERQAEYAAKLSESKQ